MRRKNTDDTARFMPMFLAALTALSFLSTLAVYVFTRGMEVVVIANTKVAAQPIVDYFWPVLMLAMTGTVFCCSVAGLFFYTRIQKKIRKPSVKLRQDLQRVASGDFSKNVEFWNAEDIYEVAVDLEKARESLKNKLIMVNDRYNAVKNFLDQKNFEVNGHNQELLKQKLQSVDDLLKGFTLRRQTSEEPTFVSRLPPMSVEPQTNRIVKDAEEMIRN